MAEPRTSRFLRRLAGALAVLLLLFLATEALARVGGGGSYGGGGDGGGGGRGDGEGLVWLVIELLRVLIWLCIEYPAVGLPLTAVFIVVVVLVWRAKARRHPYADWDSDRHAGAPAPRRDALAEGLAALREVDTGFSRFALLDFCGLLFTRYHEARGSGSVETLRAYLSEGVGIPRGGVDAVGRVVIGSLKLTRIQQVGRRFEVDATYEANYDEAAGGRAQRYYVLERWTLARDAGVQSPAPDVLSALRCPSCGSAEQTDTLGRCSFCHNVVNDGRFGWVVKAMVVLQRSEPPPIPVGRAAGGDERGTDLPTRYQPDLAARMRALSARNPDFTWAAFEARARHAFLALQEAWSTRRWEKARPFETDYLFQTHRFWIERYEAQGVRNAVEDVVIERVDVCAVERDAWYETVTARIFASALDYTIDAGGKLVEGSNKHRRRFSEYWTFLRRAGGKPKAEHYTNDSCPSCGAPLKITAAGVCEYCRAKVVSGEFDWVLALIEQDEARAG